MNFPAQTGTLRALKALGVVPNPGVQAIVAKLDAPAISSAISTRNANVFREAMRTITSKTWYGKPLEQCYPENVDPDEVVQVLFELDSDVFVAACTLGRYGLPVRAIAQAINVWDSRAAAIFEHDPYAVAILLGMTVYEAKRAALNVDMDLARHVAGVVKYCVHENKRRPTQVGNPEWVSLPLVSHKLTELGFGERGAIAAALRDGTIQIHADGTSENEFKTTGILTRGIAFVSVSS